MGISVLLGMLCTPGMTWKVLSSMPSSISDVMTFTRGNFLHTTWMPSGAAIRLRNRTLPSSTPFESTTCRWYQALSSTPAV